MEPTSHSSQVSSHLTKIITKNPSIYSDETIESWNKELPDEVVPKRRSVIKGFPTFFQLIHIRPGSGPETTSENIFLRLFYGTDRFGSPVPVSFLLKQPPTR